MLLLVPSSTRVDGHFFVYPDAAIVILLDQLRRPAYVLDAKTALSGIHMGEGGLGSGWARR